MALKYMMKHFRFKKIDAFATANSGGNPAGAIYLDSLNDMSDEEMLRIAKELQGFVNEVGYIAPLDEDRFRLRYYSSEREVDFCGHATIAILYDLIKHDKKLLAQKQLHIVTNKGESTVENRIPEEDAVFITAPAPVFSPINISKDQIAEALRIEPAGISAEAPAEVVNGGLQTLVVPLNDLPTILGLKPDIAELKNFCVKHALDIIIVFSAETADQRYAYRTRVFAPTFGYLEDPATGSGNAAFGYYLLQQKRWNGALMALEQNGSAERPNTIKLATQQDTKQGQRVVFGGGAIVRIAGEYHLT